MRFNIVINQQKCLQADLNANQAALMQLFNELHSWATERVIKGKTYWHISRNKVIEEIPLFYKKPDTVYRAFLALADKNLIEYINQNRMDFVRLTPQGMRWNVSEMNPRKLGNESELGNESGQLGNESEFGVSDNTTDNKKVNPDYSELNPTYNIHNNTNDKRAQNALEFLAQNQPSAYEAFLMKYQTRLAADFDRYKESLNSQVVIELSTNKIAWEPNAILARAKQYADSWLNNNANNLKVQGGTAQQEAKLPSSNRIELKKRQ